MIPLPSNDPRQQVLPPGTFMLTDDLVTALSKIPDTLTATSRPLAYPEREGPWLFLPGGSSITVRVDDAGERLVAVHRGDGEGYAADRALVMKHLD